MMIYVKNDGLQLKFSSQIPSDMGAVLLHCEIHGNILIQFGNLHFHFEIYNDWTANSKKPIAIHTSQTGRHTPRWEERKRER